MSNNKKILLTLRKWFKESWTSNPLGVLDLASYWRQNGHEVTCKYIEGLETENENYDVIALSVFTQSEGDEYLIPDLLFLKKKYPTARLIVGGRYFTNISKNKIFEINKIGVEVCEGYGEELFGPTLNGFENYPAWAKEDVINLDCQGYNLMSSRGCPYHCAFCHNIEKKITLFPVDRTVKNARLLLEQGLNEIFFVDDVFTVNSKHMNNLLQEFDSSGIDIRERNVFFTHVNFINDKTLKAISSFKPREVQIGVEAGDNQMLASMEKGFTIEKARENLYKLCDVAPVCVLFLIGFPGETLKSLEATLSFINNIRSAVKNIYVSQYQPVPCTKGHELAKQSGTMCDIRSTNTDIAYIPDGLSAEILIDYRAKMMG